MRKSIAEIREIAADYVRNNMKEYERCENCMYFKPFYWRDFDKLKPIFGAIIKECGICTNTKGANGEPIIIHKDTNQTDASHICGDECFEIDDYTKSLLIEQRYNAIEHDYWE